MRELKVLWMAFKTTLQTRLEYRVDFFMGLAGSLGLQATALGMLKVILTVRPVLAGWQPAEIVALYGLTTVIQGTSELFFNHIWWTPTYIVRGQFDRLLVYPVRGLPFFLMTCPELHAIGNLAGGLAVLVYSGHLAGISAWALLGLPLWVACGSLVHTAVLVIAGTVVIRVKGSYNQLFWLVNTMLQNSKFPVRIFPVLVQGLFLVLVPMGLASFLSVNAVTGRLALWPALVFPPLAAGVMVALAWWCWERAFLGYESTGS